MSSFRILGITIFSSAFMLYQCYLMTYHDGKDSQERQVQSPESKVISTIIAEQLLYANTGKFSNNVDDYLTKDEKRSSEYSMKIKPEQNQLIISVVHSPHSVSYPAFGVVKILKSKLNTDLDKNKSRWQYLEILSFVCNNEKPNTPVPSDLDIVNLKDKCPVGYIQTFKKKKGLTEIYGRTDI